MTQSDLIADVLAELERPAMPREAFATTLLDELLPALDTGVAAPSGSSRSSRSTWRRWRFAALAAALLVFVTGVAAATYLVSRDSSPARARGVLNGPLTLLAFDRVLAVGLDGRRHTVWRCPSRHCGLTSFAWSRDGQRLAVAVAFFRRAAAGEGLYVVDAHGHVLVHVGREQLGCREQHDLAWSPDGRTIAYACASRMLYLIGADGTNARSFRAGLAGRHSSPTWSANGRYVAFAVRSPIGTSSVYTSNPTGGQLRLVARGGQVQPGHPTAQRSPTGPDAEASNSSPHRVAT